MKLLLFLLCIPLFAETLTIDSGSPTDQFFTGGLSDFTISYPGATGDLSVRYGAFSYHIPRPPGVYLVTLNFRETGTVSAKNQRVFSVKLGGQLVLDRLDLFAVAGLTKIERNFVTASNDGFIDVDFSYTTKSAIVSSITVKSFWDLAPVATGPSIAEWYICQSGVVLAGPVGQGTPSSQAVFPQQSMWPGLTRIQGTPGSGMANYSCDGLRYYRFRLADGSLDPAYYVAVKMDEFVPDPTIWVKQ